MRRGIIGLAALLVTASMATAQDEKPTTTPAELQKQIDDHVIGEWTYEGTRNRVRVGIERVKEAGISYGSGKGTDFHKQLPGTLSGTLIPPTISQSWSYALP